MESKYESLDGTIEPVVAQEAMEPQTVLSLLEEDQLVVTKERAQLGRAKLSTGTRVLMWCLRGYVILMFVVIVDQIVNAIHSGGQ